MTTTIKGQTLHLHPHGAILWEEQMTLLLADLHLGKVAHFRRNGLAAPAQVAQANFNHLRALLDLFQPERVLFLGDLFHSSLNHEWLPFSQLLLEYSHVIFELVKGNHDILPEQLYKASSMLIHEPPLVRGPFVFSHYPLEKVQDTHYNFYGHLHPGVLLEGFGRQVVKLPCFHFGKTQAVLPAFGAFTGLSVVRPEESDQVFVIAEGEVVAL